MEIRFAGNANKKYVLQAKDALNAVEWQTISTNQADLNGIGFFRDPDTTNHPTRFYRIATP